MRRKITVSIPAVSNILFDNEISGKPVEKEESFPELKEANEMLEKMSEDIKQGYIYGKKGN
jgi:hypothetical protein